MANWGQPKRGFRIPDALYESAQRVAAERGETLSEIVRRALEEYVREHEGEPEER